MKLPPPCDRHFGCKVVLSASFLKSDTGKNYKTTGARGTDHPPFSNFLFTNLFSIKFLYFFIISTLFPYFNLFVSIFIQSHVNIKLHVSTLLDIFNNYLRLRYTTIPTGKLHGAISNVFTT